MRVIVLHDDRVKVVARWPACSYKRNRDLNFVVPQVESCRLFSTFKIYKSKYLIYLDTRYRSDEPPPNTLTIMSIFLVFCVCSGVFSLNYCKIEISSLANTPNEQSLFWNQGEKNQQTFKSLQFDMFSFAACEVNNCDFLKSASINLGQECSMNSFLVQLTS